MATRAEPKPPPIALPPQLRSLALRVARGFMRKLPKNVLVSDLEQAALIGAWDSLRLIASRGDRYDERDSQWYVLQRIRGSIIDELRAQDWLPRRTRAVAAMTGERPWKVIRSEDIGPGFEANLQSALPSPEDDAIAASDRASLLGAKGALDVREARLLHLHYRRGFRFIDIADEFGVSEPRVSQLHQRAISRLRTHLAADEPQTDQQSPMEGAH